VRVLWSLVRYGVLAAGATMLCVGWREDVRLLHVGATVLLAAVGWLLAVRHGKPASDAYEQGHQAGYDKGYCEGRRVARPVVVDLKPWDEDSEKVS
jgi:hypothetical protein